MQIRRIQIIVILSLLIGNTKAELAFDSTRPTSTEKKTTLTNEQLSKTLASKVSSHELTLGKVNIEKDEINIKTNLKRFEIILTKEKKEENIFSIEMNRIVCYLQLARIYRVKSGGKTIVQDEEIYLKKAMDTIELLLKKEKISLEAKGQLKYFQGIALMDMGMKESSRKSFEEAVEIYPEAKYVPSLSLYLSDMLYDENDLNKALTSYQRFYDRLSPEEKDLADYKIAWINLNQSKVDAALELFKKLIQSSNAFSIVQDSALSIAVAWSDRYEQDEVLKRVDELKISEEKKVKILQSVYDSYLKSETRVRRKIWERLLKSVTSEEEVTKLLSSEIEFLNFRDKYESDLEMLNFIHQYLKNNSQKINKYQPVNLMALGQDVEELIARSLAIYQKEKSAKAYRPLGISVDSYLLFKTFKRQVEVASLNIDLLGERKENDKLISFCWDVLKNPIYASLEYKAKLTILLDLEKKYIENPKEHQKRFFNLLKMYLKDPKADQWESVSLRYYDYLIKVSMFSEAEEQINNIYKLKATDDNFLKLIAVNYELKKCPEILDLIKDKKELSRELNEYKRECFLASAKESRKSLAKTNETIDVNHFINYQKSILEFISLAEGAKKTAAIADYLNTFESFIYNEKNTDNIDSLKKDFDELINVKYFPQRFEKEMFPVFQHEIDRLVNRGDFEKAKKFLEECEHNKKCSVFSSLHKKLIEMKAMDDALSSNKLSEQKIEDEVVNYTSLLSPETIVDKFLKNEMSVDKRLVLVSSRLMKTDWSDEKNKLLYEKLVSLLNKDEIQLSTIGTWKSLNKVNLPEVKGKHRLRDQDVLYLMKKVQATRKNIISDLGKVSFENQKIILIKAQEIENKMADIVNASPMPKNLDPSKKSEYEAGLKQLADEFVKQAETYQQTIATLVPQIELKAAQALELNSYQTPNNIDDWHFENNSEQSIAFRNFVKNGQFYQAFFYIDYLNSINKISKEEYYFNRAVLLLMSAVKRTKKESMFEYVKNELEANKQSNILAKWKEESKK